jgi:hypothetical protein
MFPAVEDWEYWLRVAAHWKFAVVRRYQVLYRLSTKSMSSDVDAMETSATRLLEHAMQAAPASGVSRNECLANLKQYCAFLYMTRAPGSDSIARAGRRLRESIRLHPRILLGPKTHRLVCAWFLLRLAPRAAAPRVVRALMRLHGRWMRLRNRGHEEGRLPLPA